MLRRKLLSFIDALLFGQTVKILRHDKDLPLPRYMTSGSAGFDLYAAVSSAVVIYPNQSCLIPTGISVELPVGYELQIRSRSGLAAKDGIIVLNSPGTIDSDYRGEIKVILYNAGQNPFTVSKGDRIAQAVLARVYKAKFVETDILTGSGRGQNGFGSTGI